MNAFYRYCAMTAMLTLATPALSPTMHAAAATTPTPPPASNADDVYPYDLPLTFEISHGSGRELNSVTDLMITVQRAGEANATTILDPVDPFTPQNGCARPMPLGLSACVLNADRSVATLRVNWRVLQPGSYRIVVSARRGTQDRETLAVFTLETVA